MKTKAQELGITVFPYIEYDEKGNESYYETKDGYWSSTTYNENGLITNYKNHLGMESKCVWDSQNRITYFEDSTGYWLSREYDENGNIIKIQDSNGNHENNKRMF